MYTHTHTHTHTGSERTLQSFLCSPATSRPRSECRVVARLWLRSGCAAELERAWRSRAEAWGWAGPVWSQTSHDAGLSSRQCIANPRMC